MNESLILSIETSACECSVALVEGGQVIAEVSQTLMHGQAARLMALIEELFVAANCDITQITHVAVNRGPGSFTGIRLGLAAAYGFAAAGNLPILGLTSFQIHRWVGGKSFPMLIALDTRRHDFYACFYGAHQINYEWARVATLEEIKKFVQAFKGSLTIISDKEIAGLGRSAPPQILRAKDGGLTAEGLLKNTDYSNSFSNDPFYLRPPAVHEIPIAKDIASPL